MTRILFVDEGSQALTALSGQLETFRDTWTMASCNGGSEAIAMLQAQPFDVVVSNLRTQAPGGQPLLRHLQDKYSHLVRIALASDTELDTALLGTPLAHQFLSKGCRADELGHAIERASQIVAMISDERIRALIGSVDRLPTPPAIYARLSEALQSNTLSIGDAAKIVESDPGMCAKILRLVSSSFFGTPRKTINVRDAIAYLGTNMIRHLVISLAMTDSMGGARLPPGFYIEKIGREGQLVGMLARKIMKHNRIRADEAFAAGLLHDVGQLVLAAYAPKLFARAYGRSNLSKAPPLHEVEVQEYALTHAQIGAYLLALWGLPWSIVEAVANHHHAPQTNASSLEVRDAVYLATTLLDELTRSGSGAGREPIPSAIDPAYLAKLGVADRLASWQTDARDLIAAAGA